MQLNAHVHGNAQRRVNGPLNCIGFDDGTTRLVCKQVNGVGRMVPQQMIGPAASLAQGIHVGATEEVSLNIHLLNVELACFDFLMDPLVAGIETTGVTAHGHLTRFLGKAHHFFGIFPAVCQWNFYLNVLTRFQACNRLRRMHLCGGAQNDSVYFWQGQAVRQVGGDVLDAIFVSHFFCFFKVTADQ